ncbi:unnamed protein product [Cylicocyclus nassatus]|uniref:Uncharacterized protein n=1 Tax=Cylicocyclus nassatus TaxID=53992 RepID=A0AA36HHM1_CYLNA|nr:unnamed protein product [Cylicocyclus nassatus]
MVNLFKLNNTQRRFFTCCGKLHVKLAFGIIILLTVFAETVETFHYIKGTIKTSSFITYTLEIWEYIVTVTMVLAFIQESTLLMLPYIVQMFVVVTLMFMFLCHIIFCIFAPYSSTAEQMFVEFEKAHYSLADREVHLIIAVIIAGGFTFVGAWFLVIALSTYQYFDFMNMKRTRKSARHEQLPVLVQPSPSDVQPPPPPTPAPSFPNPNFAGNSDDEDEVFEKSPYLKKEMV